MLGARLSPRAPASRRSGLIRRDEDQDFQPLTAVIPHAVFFTGRGHRALSWSQDVRLGSHLEGTLPLENQIDLILLPMNMAFLFLTGFKTIYVAKETRRLKDIVFLHFI